MFVHPNASSKIYQDLAAKHSAIEPPIWAGLLANAVLRKGFSAEILDTEVLGYTYEQAAKAAIDVNPKIFCFVVYGQQPSASSQNMEGACEIAKRVKENSPESFIIFVGGHVAALPEETLNQEPFIDAVCTNEGVYALLTLCRIKDYKDKNALLKVDGICFRNDKGHPIFSGQPKVVDQSDLDNVLPGIAWDLLPSLRKYRTAGWHSWSNNCEKEPFAALYTSLGCPFKCSFCMINIINRTNNNPSITSADSSKFRHWSPDFIISQFDYFAKIGVKNVKIADELFVLNPNHFLKICELLILRKYEFNIWAYSRIDTCQPKYLETLKKAGVNWLGLGIENPNTILRKEIHKDGFKEIKIKDIVKSIQNSGISVGGNYIFGLPQDTHESMNETLSFAMENPTEMVNFYSAMAYPGSPLYQTARQNGVPLPQTYSGFSQHAYDTLNMSNGILSAKEILQFRDQAWTAYNTSSKYLKFLEKRFGLKAVEDISNTTKIRLKRNLLGD